VAVENRRYNDGSASNRSQRRCSRRAHTEVYNGHRRTAMNTRGAAENGELAAKPERRQCAREERTETGKRSRDHASWCYVRRGPEEIRPPARPQRSCAAASLGRGGKQRRDNRISAYEGSVEVCGVHTAVGANVEMCQRQRKRHQRPEASDKRQEEQELVRMLPVLMSTSHAPPVCRPLTRVLCRARHGRWREQCMRSSRAMSFCGVSASR